MPSCPHCGFTVDADARTCPLCGSPVGGEAPERTADSGGAPGTGGLDWEDPDRPFLASLFEAWRTSLFEPTRFFRQVSWEGGFGRPLLYYLVAVVVAALFNSVWQALWLGAFGRRVIGLLWGMAGMHGWRWSGNGVLLRFFLSPFYGLVGLGIAAAVFHVFVLILVRDRRGLGATARVVCYSMGPAVLSVVPVLGPLAAYLVWIPILQVVGLREAHRTSTGRAVAVWLGPLVILLLLSLALTLLVLLVAGGYGGGSGVLRRI